MGAAHRQAGAVAEDGPKPSFLSREEPERAWKKVGDAVARSRPTAARRAMKRGQWEAFVTTRRITLGRTGTSFSSEARLVGKGGVRTFRSRWSPFPSQKTLNY